MEAYALRYWEEEFPTLRPRFNSSGRRIYTEEDLEAIRRIQELLYDERYTIPGARQRLLEESENQPTDDVPALGPNGRALVWAAGDKGGGAAIHLEATLDSARRIERTLDRLAEDSDADKTEQA